MGAKDLLDDVGRASDRLDRIKGWFASLTCIGIGAVVFVGPGTLGEEVPQHRLVGAGFAAFGLVFLLALALKGRAGSRAKNALLFLTMAAISGALGFVAYREGRIAWLLEREGVEYTLPVHGSVPRFSGNSSWWDLEFRDGLRRYRLEWDSAVAVGTPMTFLVHPEHARWTAAVGAGASAWEIAEARETKLRILATAGGALLFALSCLWFLWATVAGAAAPDEDAAVP